MPPTGLQIECVGEGSVLMVDVGNKWQDQCPISMAVHFTLDWGGRSCQPGPTEHPSDAIESDCNFLPIDQAYLQQPQSL